MLPRILCSLTLVLMTVGCASTRPQPTASTTMLVTRAYAEPGYSYPASALVFDPPASRYLPPLDLSRDVRQPMAFGGFPQAANTFTYTWTYDHQSTDFLDSYDRFSTSVQVGSSVR